MNKILLMGRKKWTPLKIAGCYLWLKAGDITGVDGDAVAAWNDASGKASNFAQATETKQPLLKKTTNGINSHNVVRFDGVDDLLIAGVIDSSSQGAVFIVHKVSSTSPQNYQVLLSSRDEASTTRFVDCVTMYNAATNRKAALCQRNNDTQDALTGHSRLPFSTGTVGTYFSDGSTSGVRINGYKQTFTLAAGANNGDWFGDVSGRDNFTIGAGKWTSETSFFKGDIAEIIAYNTSLSAAQILKVEQYLGSKYGIGIATAPATARESMQRAVAWLKVGQDVNTAGGGMSDYYNPETPAWKNTDYKETTGYIINTLFDMATYLGDADCRTRAISAADWLVSVQHALGHWSGYAFDTGQVLLGLCRAYGETSDADYLTSIVKAADWLLANQDVAGGWSTVEYGGAMRAAQSRVAWALLRAWQVTVDEDYKTAAIACLEWVLTQQNAVGWFEEGDIDPAHDANPLTHSQAYAAQGLLESGLILEDTDYINAAILTANNVLTLIAADGGLTGGRYHNDWTVHDAAECLTGSCQMADVWWKLYHYNSTAGYKTAAQNMNAHMRNLQAASSNTGIDGGIYGSDPIEGIYMQYLLPNWAVKFFIDALYDEVLYG